MSLTLWEVLAQIDKDKDNVYVEIGKKLLKLSEAPLKKQVLFVKTEMNRLLEVTK